MRGASSVAVSVLVLSGLVAVPAAASAAVVPSVSQPQALSPAQQAAATGEPVVVDELTTPTEQTSAMPDGTMQYEVSTVPVRVERDGEWIPVDTDLVRRGEWLEPDASAAPVRFSPGGTTVLSQVRTESGEWVSEIWPDGPVPTPRIDGDTATYPEIKPGVDLKLVATKTGVASIYVVKSAEAAKSSDLEALRTVVRGAELSRNETGTVSASASDGSDLLAAQPLWWDSSNGGTYREPGGEAPPKPVSHDVVGDGVAMDVGASVETQEKKAPAKPIQYPIFVDPDWSTGIAGSWYTDAAFPNTSYLSAGASDVLRVGAYEEYVSNMFFQFPIGALGGKRVLGARLNTMQLSVDACGAGAISSHLVSPMPAGFTWNQEQEWRQNGQMWWSGAMQFWYGPDCGAAPMPVGWDVTYAVSAVAGRDSQVEIGFTYESMQSRRHYDRGATLIVTYNTPPNTPTDPVFLSPAKLCGTAAAPTQIAATDVTVAVNQTDPDPENVDVNFYLMRANDLDHLFQRRTPGLGAQGQKVVTFNGLTDGETYAWEARGSDWRDDSPGLSPWCYFTVDVTKPALPTITSSATSFTVGAGMSVSLAGDADVAGYTYWVTPTQLVSPAPSVPADGTVSTSASTLPDCNGRVTANVRWACGSGATPVAITVAPTDSLSTLWVSAYDKAGNQSEARGLPLYTAIGTPAASANVDAGHAWQVTSLLSPLPSVVPDSNPWIGTSDINLHLPSGASVTSTDAVVPPLPGPVMKTGPLPSAGDEIVAPTAPVNAANSFTWSMWVKATLVPSGKDQIVAVQSRGSGRGEVKLLATQGGQYSFCITGSSAPDDNGRPVSSCVTGGSLAVNSWQMITGIWDTQNQQLRLLIGNSITPVAVAGHVLGSGDWSASGPLIFGPSPDTNRFNGYIANPAFLPDVVDHRQLDRMVNLSLPFSE